MSMTKDHVEQKLIIDPASGNLAAPEPAAVGGRDYVSRLVGAGVTVAGVTLAAHADGFEAFLHNVHAYLCLFEADRDRVRHVRSCSDIDGIRRGAEVGVIFGSQTGSIVGRDVWRWEIVRALGLRLCCLTYSERNALADGCAEPTNWGLTADGRQAVHEMNRLGITIDISHVGERSSLEAIELSSQPVIASHSNVRAVSASVRNLSDEVMKSLATRGGVMGITPFSATCARDPGVRPTLTDYVDMIDRAVQSIGIDHVAIGTDLYESYTKLTWESSTKRLYPSGWRFETRYAEGFDSVDCWGAALEAIAGRGYSGGDLEKLLGENWLRVLQATWLAGDETPPHLLQMKGVADAYFGPSDDTLAVPLDESP